MKLYYLVLLVFCLSGCGATLCTKGNTKQGVFFDYGFGYVSIGGSPDYTANASWVRKFILKSKGFLIVSAQKTVHCDNFPEMKRDHSVPCKGHKLIDKYTVFRYTDDHGYQEWFDNIPQSEWETITSIDHVFSKAPTYHYENCRYRLFGSLYQFLMVLDRV